MEIKKNYELRQFGNKVALIVYSLDSSIGYTECKMRALIEADALVGNEHILSGGDVFFVLRVGEEFILCRDMGRSIYTSWPCKEYRLINPDVLFFQQDIWWRWTPEKMGVNEPLGNYAWNNFHNLFVHKQNSLRLPFVIHYYEEGQHKSMACKEFTCFSDKLNGINDQYIDATHYDVMKIVDEKGKTLWLSIKQEIGPSYALAGRLTERKPVYHFIFSQKPQKAGK